MAEPSINASIPLLFLKVHVFDADLYREHPKIFLKTLTNKQAYLNTCGYNVKQYLMKKVMACNS